MLSAGDSGQAEKAAEALKITADDLVPLGIVDGVVPEPPNGAHEDYETAARNLADQLRSALDELSSLSPDELVEDRYAKFRRMAAFFSE